MFNWNVEEMKLMNNTYSKMEYGYRTEYYNVEMELSTEEKEDALNKFSNGKYNYFKSLNEKYCKALEDGIIKKNSWGYAKENSKKSWIRKNDKELIFWNGKSNDNFWTYDYIHLWGSGNIYFGHKITTKTIDENFHYLCKDLASKEKSWFCSHDEYEMLKTEFRKGGEYFNICISSCSDGTISIYDKDTDERRPITIDELKTILSARKKVEEYVEQLSKEINIKY